MRDILRAEVLKEKKKKMKWLKNLNHQWKKQ